MSDTGDHQGQGQGVREARRRSTIVSFSKDKDEISIDGDDEDFHMSLAPYIQTYLAHSRETVDCCGLCLPVPFERASKKSWWDPRFDSEILEGQYRKSTFSQIRLRFRYALIYLIVLAVSWSLYLMALSILDETFTDAFPLGLIYFFFVVVISLVLLFTRSPLYRQYTLPASVLISLVMCSLSLASVSKSPALSPGTDFAICLEILLIIYTVIPLPLYACVIICSAYSVVFELLGVGLWPAKIFLHVSVHLIGLHIYIMTNVRMRGTFMKVGQSLLVRKQLEMEKQLKEKMIRSVMPQDVAKWLLEEEGGGKFLGGGGDIDSLFRPFKMSCMKDVSILFADIVGFTRMSSNKTASQLVTVLNELFERFDELCVHNGCEKISTLGDCYYCVSGCPTARQDHAQCCVEMGLGMIKAIAEFDREKHEAINMRVGVHTGTVLCGIVGRRRFKFDVWSNDVSLANKMESSGRPGQVHISEATRKFLGDLYVLEKGEEYHGLDTFFIVSRKEDVIDEATPATVTSLTSNTLLTTDPSFETALMSNADSLITAPSHARSTKSSSNVNCTISPFDTITDSRLFSDLSATPSPPSNVIPHLLCVSDTLSEDLKATSLPNVFAKESNGGARPSILGSGPLLTRKPLPSWKYSRLKLSSLDVENGKVQKTYKVASSGEPSPVEKANNQLEVPKDDLSFCQSVNSRKDSGIRSNSRRSSIQQQLFALNGVQSDLMNHRVSGYYTSSQSSLNGSFQGKFKSKLPGPLTDSLGACFQKIRKQSDLQLIRCVQDNSKSERSYFVTPPLKRWSLLFKYPDMEKEYREKAHRAFPTGANYSLTLATARFNTYFDITVSFIVFSSVSLSLFIMFSLNVPWMTTFLVLLGLQLAVISLCIYSVAKPVVTSTIAPLLSWYPWHVIGGVLVSLPAIAVLSNFELSSISQESVFIYSSAVFVGLVHYCNFTQLNCWMKSALASLAGSLYLILTTFMVLSKPQLWAVGNATFDNYNFTYDFSSAMHFIYDFRPTDLDYPAKISTLDHDDHEHFHPDFSLSDSQIETLRRSYFFIAETHLGVFLVVLLVWFLNREFEISYRLSFHGNAVAAKDKAKVEEMKIQAEKLLYNIIPKHVAEHLKTTSRYRYSEDIKNVGVIFASVINFGEMYDESYLDGRECLRVLNELVSDFDDLLSKEQFSMVEKIKTIGSTFMAASGLNPSQRKEGSNEHLYQLMEFAFALQGTIENFNTHLLSFKLILRVGFNFGDVTAGVIGTNKLHYDIWGDAVNIASRMDTTGVANRIQVPKSCVPVLSQRYRLEHRGTVFVKGKDNMDVHLIKDRIEPPLLAAPVDNVVESVSSRL